MDRAHAGTRQNGNGQFRHHAHVQTHAVAFLDSVVFEHVGKLHDAVVQFPVGVYPVRGGGIVWFKDQGRLIAQGVQMAVQAVLCNVQGSPCKPLDLRIFEVPREDAVPFSAPNKLLGNLGPKVLGILHALGVSGSVLGFGGKLKGEVHGNHDFALQRSRIHGARVPQGVPVTREPRFFFGYGGFPR